MYRSLFLFIDQVLTKHHRMIDQYLNISWVARLHSMRTYNSGHTSTNTRAFMHMCWYDTHRLPRVLPIYNWVWIRRYCHGHCKFIPHNLSQPWHQVQVHPGLINKRGTCITRVHLLWASIKQRGPQSVYIKLILILWSLRQCSFVHFTY